MARWLRHCIHLALLLIAAAGVEAATIRGVPGCAYWLRDREPDGHSSYFNAMWLVGYLSGAAVHSDKDVLRTLDSESIAAWMDGYCKANPSSTIAEGGEMLFEEMARRLPPDKTGGTPAAWAVSASVASARPQPPDAPGSTASLRSPAAAEAPPPATPSAASVKAEALPPPAPSPASVKAEPPALSAVPGAAPSKMMTPVATPAATPPEPDTPPTSERRATEPSGPAYAPRVPTLANALPLTSSKYQFKAEQFAKANGCMRATATMNIRTPTSETFAVTCADGAALAVRCDPDCRDLQ